MKNDDTGFLERGPKSPFVAAGVSLFVCTLDYPKMNHSGQVLRVGGESGGIEKRQLR